MNNLPETIVLSTKAEDKMIRKATIRKRRDGSYEVSLHQSDGAVMYAVFEEVEYHE